MSSNDLELERRGARGPLERLGIDAIAQEPHMCDQEDVRQVLAALPPAPAIPIGADELDPASRAVAPIGCSATPFEPGVGVGDSVLFGLARAGVITVDPSTPLSAWYAPAPGATPRPRALATAWRCTPATMDLVRTLRALTPGTWPAAWHAELPRL